MIELLIGVLLYLPTNTSVVVDSEIDGYRVTGEMYLDQTFTGSQSTKKVAATCKDCRWIVSNYCKRESPFEAIAACELPSLQCETDLGDGVKMRVWRQISPDQPWQDQGVVCIGPKGPITPKVISQSIKEEVIVYLPTLNPTTQPMNQALVKLPVNFLSNQPNRFGPTIIRVAGIDVELIAYPTWTWEFSSQDKITTNNPGRGYPDGTVTHTWNKSGGYRVEVSTKWKAQWQISDETEQEPQLAEELVQRSSIFLQIRPAWGQLTR
jgi:hypothetical protein